MNIAKVTSTNFSYSSNTDFSNSNNTNKTDKHDTVNKNSINKSLIGKPKKNSLLENLMKQKENLTDSKNTLIENASKNGDDPSSVKEKLKEINKQIEEIDKQINNLQLEDQRKALGIDEKNKKNEHSKQKQNKDSSDNTQTDNSTSNILDLSNGLTTAKALSSQRKILSGNARVLDNEIKTDEKRGIDPIRKKECLAKMNDNIEKITKKLGKQINDMNSKMNNNIESDKSNTDTIKNIQNNNINNDTSTEIKDPSIIQQLKVSQSIEKYVSNSKDNIKNNGEKINIVS